MRVSSLRANADVIGLASFTFIAYVDIIAACGEIDSGGFADRDVAAAGGVTTKGTIAHGGIAISRSVSSKGA